MDKIIEQKIKDAASVVDVIGDGLTEKLIRQESNSRYYYIGIKITDNDMPFAPTEEKVPF